MNRRSWLKRLPKYVGIPLVIALVFYLVLNGLNGWGGQEVCAGISLMAAVGGMMYLKQMENKAEKNVAQRIKAEFPIESQQQVFETYEHLKIKELEGLFLKILDDANRDASKVKKLASIAENVGWKAFLENKW